MSFFCFIGNCVPMKQKTLREGWQCGGTGKLKNVKIFIDIMYVQVYSKGKETYTYKSERRED